MPGPQAGGKASLIPTSVNVGEDANRSFFLSLIPQLSGAPSAATTQGPSGNFGRWKTDWTLSDMQERVAVLMVDNTKDLLNLERDETWYYQVCPVINNQGTLKFRINKTFFRPRVVEEAPPRTVPYNLDIQQTEGTIGLTRYHSGFELDSETMLGGVQRGVKWFHKRVAMMVEGIIESDKLFIISAMMRSDLAQRTKDEQMLAVLQSRGLQSHILWEINTFGSAAKERAPLQAWINSANVDWRVLGVRPTETVTIMHEHTLRLISQENEYYTEQSRGGDARMLYDGPDAITAIRGFPIYTVRDFLGPVGEVINPIGAVVEHGLYYTATDVHRFAPQKPYISSARDIKITDPGEKSMVVLNFLENLAAGERWDLSTGDLRSLVTPDGKWRAGSEERRSIGGNAGTDAFHVVHGEATWSGVDVAPARYWGALKKSSLSTSYLRGCATTVCANLSSVQDYDSAINSFMALVSEAGNAPLVTVDATGVYNSPALDLIAPTAAILQSYNSTVGCKPINGNLKFTARDASTHFAATGLVLAGQTAIPALYGRLSAMRASRMR